MDHKWVSRCTCGKPNAVPKPFRGLRVLLVDNDTNSLLYISSVLEEQSYKVRTIELASVALSLLQGQPNQFDVLLADLDLPEMDNFEFLKQIQLISGIPIILMSSTIEMDMVWEAKTEGACFVLEKPISAEQLKNIWQHVYRKRRYQMMENKNENVEKEVDGEATFGGVCKIASGNDLQYTQKKNLSIDISGKRKDIEVEVNLVATKIDKPQGSKRRCIEDEYGDKGRSERSGLDLKRSYYTKGLKANEEVERDMNDKDNGHIEKKSRFSWTPDVHLKFMEAMVALGTNEARPKKVLEMMNVPNLTQRQVASHLQKYRDRIRDNDTPETLPSWRSAPPFTMTNSTSNFYGGDGFLHQVPYGPNIPNTEIGVDHSTHHTPTDLQRNPKPTSASDLYDYAFEALDNFPKYAYLSGDYTKNPSSYRANCFGFQEAFSANREEKQPSAYDDVIKMLEGEEELEDFSGKITTSDIDKYSEWLGTHLLGNSSSSNQEQPKGLNSDKSFPQ